VSVNFPKPLVAFTQTKLGENQMSNKNNIETNENQNETALDENTLIFVVGTAIVSFAIGFCIASALAAAQIAAMLATQ
jgi:hypothetical protein